MVEKVVKKTISVVVNTAVFFGKIVSTNL